MASKSDPFEDVLRTSGNSFHCRVANAFRAAGWTVLLSPYYVDNATDKAREVDLLCEKYWQVPHGFIERLPPRQLRIQLVVECKYIPESTATVFWFDDRNNASVEKYFSETFPFFHGQKDLEHHHYNSRGDAVVAKTFQSSPRQAEDREPMFTALTQCTQALLGPLPELTTIPNDSTLTEKKVVKYGVVVCSTFDRFRGIPVAGGALSEIQQNFQFELNYAWRNTAGKAVRTFALVDIVSFERMSEFFAAVEREVDRVRLQFAERNEVKGWPGSPDSGSWEIA